MLYMSDLSNGQKDPHFKPSTGASINPAQNIQMLSIIKDIRGAGQNLPPLSGSSMQKKGWW